MILPINDTIRSILITIKENGFEGYLVGGAVRDTILSKSNRDYDICTNMPLELIKEVYPQFHLMKPNINRTTGVLRIDGFEIEISEYKGKTIEEDLSKRDFTLNAMALDCDGHLIDPYNGYKSIQEKKISLIDKQGGAFEEDPLRILRGIRIASKLNFDISPNCKCRMELKRKLLKNIAVERIYRELIQILISDRPSKYIRDNIYIFFEVLPELKPMYQFNQNNPWHIYDVLEHTLVTLDNTEKNIFLRLAALFHDVGKPHTYFTDKDGVGHFYGHPTQSEEIFRKIACRLKMDNKTRDRVAKIIYQHDSELSAEPDKIYNFLLLHGFEHTKLLFALKRADNLGQNPEYAKDALLKINKLEETYQQFMLKFDNLKINGSKLAEMGYSGKRIKLILNDVTKMIVTGELPNDEVEILEYINRRHRI